ncbi:MAG TPA: hypothetical protein PKH58_09895 [Paludibacteraceae bacterium]|nr:hypothetical protein [Paludibacteraceae bacterium]
MKYSNAIDMHYEIAEKVFYWLTIKLGGKEIIVLYERCYGYGLGVNSAPGFVFYCPGVARYYFIFSSQFQTTNNLDIEARNKS